MRGKQLCAVYLESGFYNMLKHSGLYQRAKASCVYDLYWTIANREVIADRRRETKFYRQVLAGFQKGQLIFDIGANQGYKTGIFLALGARVLAVEPDRANQKVLQQRYVKYRLKKKPVVIVDKAVSESDGIGRLMIDAPGSAKNTLSQKWADTLRGDDKRFGKTLDFKNSAEVQTVTISQLIAEYGRPFFIKIDVEGHELSVLRGMREAVPYLSFETNLPEFRREGIECIRLLQDISGDGEFNYSSDCAKGLVLDSWLRADGFCGVFEDCTEPSIEIFWRAAKKRH